MDRAGREQVVPGRNEIMSVHPRRKDRKHGQDGKCAVHPARVDAIHEIALGVEQRLELLLISLKKGKLFIDAEGFSQHVDRLL